MVPRAVPDFAPLGEFFLRYEPLGLQLPARAVGAPVLEYGGRNSGWQEPGVVAPGDGAAGNGGGPNRAGVGQLDDASEAVMRALGRFLLLAAVVAVASAHVGSPDTVFEGAAGPYSVRVVVRPPGIVPGQAEITVRLLAGSGLQSVLVLPLRGGRPTAED